MILIMDGSALLGHIEIDGSADQQHDDEEIAIYHELTIHEKVDGRGRRPTHSRTHHIHGARFTIEEVIGHAIGIRIPAVSHKSRVEHVKDVD